MSGKELATTEKRSFVPTLVLYGLAALGAFLLLRWALQIFSFVFSLAFWVVVLGIAVVVLWVKLRSSRAD